MTGQRTTVRRRRVALLFGVAALLVACRDGGTGPGDDAQAPPSSEGGAPSDATTGPAAPSSSVTVPTASTAPPGTTPPSASTPPSATTPTTPPGPTPTPTVTGPGPGSATTAIAAGFLEPAGTTAVSFPGSNRPAVLTAVRTGRQDGFDRVVFEFRPGDELPGYLVGYQDLPLRADPSDQPLSIRGEVALVVRMQAASRFDFEATTLVYQGPSTVVHDGTAITEVVLRGDFEALLSWAIGSTGRRPYRVGTLDGPPRLYVDVAT